MILVFGYLALLFTTVVLDWFGTENMFIIVLGYVESIVIFTITFVFVLGRIRKNKEVNKFSQPSDWFFVIWLLLMGLSAFIVRVFIDLNRIQDNLWMYLIHLIVLVQWALIIVPFGKWTHFLYRSFAMYFEKLKLQA
jgi:quinone-modifying oxidoreductase subunit QmoC